MSQTAVKQEITSANDAEHVKDPVGDSSKQYSVENEPTDTAKPVNNVKRSIDAFISILNEIEELRETLKAGGVPITTTRMLVELGTLKNTDKQALAIESAIQAVQSGQGGDSLTTEGLKQQVGKIATLEQELADARALAREAGLDPQVLSMVTQLVQRSPGDGGTKIVNTFLAYSLAYGIKTDKLAEITQQIRQQTASVLPQIPRKIDSVPQDPGRNLIRDMLIGLLIGAVVISMLM